MLTVLEAAKMAEAVYDSTPKIDGWTCINPRQGGIWNGFQAATFVKNGIHVLAFRGTNYSRTGILRDIKGGLASDAAADLKLGVGMNSSYFADGDDYAFAYQHMPQVYVCGHSLGGAIAQVVANRCGFKFVTFNAPGVAVVASRNIRHASTLNQVAIPLRVVGMAASAARHPVQAFRDMRAAFDPVHGLNVCLVHDRVSKIGVHYGKVERLHAGPADWETAHGMSAVLDVLKTHPIARHDVGKL
jgi:pimeloyl-ACP methyl ester carboxylesterase